MRSQEGKEGFYKVTCLGKAERKLLAVKTLQGGGKGFKETVQQRR